MKLCTRGIIDNKEYEIPLIVHKNITNIDNAIEKSRFKLIIIKSGSGIISINGEKRIVNSPSLICLNEKDEFLINKKMEIAIDIVYFHPSFINGSFNFDFIEKCQRKNIMDTAVQDLYVLNPFILRNDKFFAQIHISNLIMKRIIRFEEKLNNELVKQDNRIWICRSRSFLLELLFFISEIYSNYSSSSDLILNSCCEEIEEILLYLHMNYEENITLSCLSEYFNINRTTLNEKFKKFTGETVISYLIKLRINLASILLRDTNIPIKEIGYRVGFNDIINFGRTFKKYMGHTPQNYRNEYNWLIG